MRARWARPHRRAPCRAEKSPKPTDGAFDMPLNNPVSESFADLAAGQYTPPTRADPSSWWRDYMVRRTPGFTDPGPLPSARPPGVTTADPAITAPITTAPGPTGGQLTPGPSGTSGAPGSITQDQWMTPDVIGPGFGAALQQLGLMPGHLTYNAETRIWE